MRLSLTVPVLLLLAAGGCGGSSSSTSGPQLPPRTLVYRAMSAGANPPTPSTINQAAGIVRRRLEALHITARVTQQGDQIVVDLPGAAATPAAQRLIATTGRLGFYDWEANALTPNGKSVASQLQAQDPAATAISQGSGSPGAGSMALYDAAKLASAQPKQVSTDNSRQGPEYFMFDAPGSAACRAAAQAYGVTPTVGKNCYLAGPAENLQDLAAALPAGVTRSQGQVLLVQQGTVVLQVVPASFASIPAISDPNAQFFVLKDNVALRGSDIINPQPSTDVSGSPDVTFGFTSKGKTEFQNITAAVAHRGALVSGVGETLNQHFAVALDNQLITVPAIDSMQYPDGIPGDKGADITGGFTPQSAQEVATLLRLGPLPVALTLVSSK